VFTLSYYLNQLALWHADVDAFCDDVDFVQIIVDPWFKTIAPDRARAYGFRGFEELGPKGVFAQIANCYYRYDTLISNGHGLANMGDTLRDAFGYAIIMGIVSHTPVGTIVWKEVFRSDHDPDSLYDTMKMAVWLPKLPASGTMPSLKLAYGMWAAARRKYA